MLAGAGASGVQFINMEKDELRTLIANQSRKTAEAKAAREDVVTRRRQARERLYETHDEASVLATRLLDHYHAPVESKPINGDGLRYTRETPLLPLGEVDASSPDGKTHAFTIVRVRLAAQKTYRKKRSFPLLGTVKYDYSRAVGSGPTDNITHVDVTLYTGEPDGSGLQVSQGLNTRDGFGSSIDEEKADVEIAEQLAHREKTIEVLDCLVADLATASAAS